MSFEYANIKIEGTHREQQCTILFFVFNTIWIHKHQNRGHPQGGAPTVIIMSYDSFKHHRRSIRLKDYDYSQSGAYFITCCVNSQICLFGKIKHDKIHLNDAGIMIKKVWMELSENYPGIETDAFVVMPNHFHGIVILNNVGAGPRACP